jgi:hypothetical protein
MPGAGCARPKLLSLGRRAPVLLSGGRLCVENTTDISLWVNADGMAGYGGGGGGGGGDPHALAVRAGEDAEKVEALAWVKHSLSYW